VLIILVGSLGLASGSCGLLLTGFLWILYMGILMALLGFGVLTEHVCVLS
jgi:hypothetical protein